jgi:glycosyltransferase involved in cell wall biosynthesis
MRKITIGIKANHYPEKRNFTGLPFENIVFKKVLDLYRILNYAYFKLTKKTHPKWLNLFNDFNFGSYDVLHFFNSISLGNKPWVVTYEYQLPRGAHQLGQFKNETEYIHKGINHLKGDACKKIIALSHFAKNSQISYLKDFNEKTAKAIIAKIEVIHPSQKLLINDISDKPKNNQLKFIFVGADFFRKGGLEIIEVFDELLTKNYPIELTIISSLQYGDYASKTTQKDLSFTKEIINKYSQIKFFNYLENTKVLQLLIDSDIALLPSYDETYGYFVLEAKAAGCPVVTTNGGAFPEINSNEDGWLIEVPLVENNRSIPRSDKAKNMFSRIVKSELIRIIDECIDHPNIVKEKSENAFNRIKNNHNIEKTKNKLKSIYNDLISFEKL